MNLQKTMGMTVWALNWEACVSVDDTVGRGEA